MNENYDVGQCETKPLCVSEAITDRLLRKKRQLELELKETTEALEALNANPEICRVLTLVGRAIGRSL